MPATITVRLALDAEDVDAIVTYEEGSLEILSVIRSDTGKELDVWRYEEALKKHIEQLPADQSRKQRSRKTKAVV